MSKQILEALFDSKTKVKLLKFMFRNATDFFTLDDIVRRTREKRSSILLHLSLLEKIGLVKRKKMRLQPREKLLHNTSIELPF